MQAGVAERVLLQQPHLAGQPTLKGTLRAALRAGLRSATAGDTDHERVRGWKLFLLAPRMLLYREPGVSRIVPHLQSLTVAAEPSKPVTGSTCSVRQLLPAPGWVCVQEVRLGSIQISAEAGGPCQRGGAQLQWALDREVGRATWSCNPGSDAPRGPGSALLAGRHADGPPSTIAPVRPPGRDVSAPASGNAAPFWLSRGPPQGDARDGINSWLHVPLLHAAAADLAPAALRPSYRRLVGACAPDADCLGPGRRAPPDCGRLAGRGVSAGAFAPPA